MYWRVVVALAIVWAQEERSILMPYPPSSPRPRIDTQKRFYRIIVLDAQTQEPLPGAYVFNSSDSTGLLTDSMGVAEIGVIFHTDTVWIEVRYIGYETQRVLLSKRARVQQQLFLSPEGVQQSEVIIVSLRVYRTEVSLLASLRETPQIASGISGQVIEKTPDQTLAQVLSRIAGVSVYDGRFLNIRGMGQRYNTILINNLPAPQTEPDSRGFDLTLIPAGLLDQVLVYKSATAEYTGDFGGGIVNILTRKSEDKAWGSVSWQVGYLHQTTSQEGLQGTLSLAEGWGAGVSGQGLPKGFPEDMNTLSLSEASQWSQRLPPKFAFQKLRSLPPNGQLGFHIGVPIGTRIWTTWAASYGIQFQNLRVQRYRYEMLFPRAGVNPKLFGYEDWQTTRSIRWLGFQNWIWMPNPKNQLELNLMLSRLADDETILREGYSYYQRADAVFRNYSWQYLLRTLGMAQIEGFHGLGRNLSLRWNLGANLSEREEPDFRRVRTVRSSGDSVYRIILPPGATTFDAARFFSQMRQYSLASNLILRLQLRRWRVHGGIQSEYRSRRFSARWFSYTFPASGNPIFLESWSALPLSEAFSSEYLPYLRLREGTNPTDRYEAKQLYLAPFVSVERDIGRWHLHTGLRYEWGYQYLRSATATQMIDQRIPFPLWLPFVNAIYGFSQSHQVRLAYNRSLNRPELRELAPFLYYNFALTIEESGNPNLRPARLHNIDLRYEWLPTLKDLVAVGVFYKHIANPIETYIVRGADQPIIRFGNAEGATLLGAEVEARVQLFPAFSLIANASYVWSQVDLGTQVQNTMGAVPTQERFRPLQSQAPYLLNLIAILAPVGYRWEISSSLQVNGPRLWWVGDNFNPSVYEMPRLLWDMRWRQTFRRFFIELQARDILNQPFYYRQDTDRNGRIDRQEDVIFRFVRGSEWSLRSGLLW
ncbi:MAG: outer membrane beta-barrel protein [Bacteroidia bacterium]|nr:outer membrane beta-barrel protein [Bacteroidia bacterium]